MASSMSVRWASGSSGPVTTGFLARLGLFGDGPVTHDALTSVEMR